ncbi:SpaA isopeptide-forming pilin-related protein [Mycoplasma sp. P36-A1]|uniref:SpaA isopeptide-forming pilin-related protein n=1 Tax=Mycoplasma sp. P36-A1 TaxID=3252900 RepID=UPI003C30CA90
MKKKTHLIIGLFAVIFGIFINGFSGVQVLAATDFGDQFITKAELQDSNGNPSNSFGQYDTMNAHYEFSIPDNVQIKAGDKMTIDLPKELTLSTDLKFELTDGAGNPIGHATVDKTTGKVTIVFTDYYETHPDNKNGSFNITTQWNQENIEVGTDNPIDWGTGGSSNIHIDGGEGPSVDEKLYKWGSVDANDPSIIHWVVRVNFASEEIQDAVYTDTLGPNQTLIPGTYAGYHVASWNSDGTPNAGAYLTQGQFTTISDTEFSVELGNLKDCVYITYDAQSTDDGASSEYTNAGKLVGTDYETQEITVHTPSTGGSGSGSGNNQSVVLTKKDSEDNQKYLAGAIFKLLDGSGKVVKDNLVTDSSGKLKVNNLASGNYQFIETAAPKGYVLDKTPIDFKIVDNQDVAVKVSMVNKKIQLGSVVLTKIDSKTNKTLAGAEFKLLDNVGKVLKTDLVTNKHGKLTISDLKAGKYQLVETKAPKGYVLDATPVSFEITANQTSAVQVKKANKPKTSTVHVVDKKQEKLPQTSLGNNLLFSLIALAISSTLLGSSYLLKKNK